MIYRGCLVVCIGLTSTIIASDKEQPIFKKTFETEISKQKQKEIRKKLIKKVERNGFFKTEYEKTKQFFAITITALVHVMELKRQAKEDKAVHQMAHDQYNEIKKIIDDEYKGYMDNPLTFDMGTIRVISHSPKERSHEARRNSQGLIASIYRHYEESPAYEGKEDTVKDYKQVAINYVIPKYDESFKHATKFKSKFEKYKKRFFDTYSEANNAYIKGDYPTARQAINDSLIWAKYALWNLSQGQQEKESIKIISPLLKTILVCKRDTSSEDEPEIKQPTKKNNLFNIWKEENSEDELETGKETMPEDES